MKHMTKNSTANPSGTVKHAVHLLNQQLWCWGRDIEYPDGNLLVQHGFQRIEKPTGSKFASLYQLELSPTSRVILRGFGIFCGDDQLGGLFLRRFDFRPQLTPEPDLVKPAWSLEDLPPLAKPRIDLLPACQRLLLALIDSIRQYEVWIAEQVGIAYRTKTLMDWGFQDGAVIPAEKIAFAWQMLSEAISDHPERFIPTIKNQNRQHA